MSDFARNMPEIHDDFAADWWSGDVGWIRTAKNLAPGRLMWFDRPVDWHGKTVLDFGCTGGFRAEALAKTGANVTEIDPAQQAIEAARARRLSVVQTIR